MSLHRGCGTRADHVYALVTLRDFLLKPELLRAISDLGFEHPSEGQSELDLLPSLPFAC